MMINKTNLLRYTVSEGTIYVKGKENGCRRLAGGIDRGGWLRRKRGHGGLCDQYWRKVSSGRLSEPAEVEAGCKPWASRESRV
jgi:hypothetical protein